MSNTKLQKPTRGPLLIESDIWKGFDESDEVDEHSQRYLSLSYFRWMAQITGHRSRKFENDREDLHSRTSHAIEMVAA